MNTSLTVLLMGALVAPWVDAQADTDIQAPLRFRLMELTGDNLPDQVRMAADGRLEIAVNRGGGVFEPVNQLLPSVEVVSMLHADLNGDGNLDIYVVSRGPNVALLGDGRGGMTEATEALGLVDNGSGLTAEMIDVDGDDDEDLVLHNALSDVLFWGGTAGFQRAEPPPTVIYTAPQPSMSGDYYTGYVGMGGASSPGSPASGGELTEAQADVLRHLEIVTVPDDDGRPTPTLRIKGVNVQMFPRAGSSTAGTVTSSGTLNGSPFSP